MTPDLSMMPDTAPQSVPELDGDENTGKPCAWEGCGLNIPGHGQDGFSHARKFCDFHSAESKKNRSRKKKGDTPPVDVSINLGTPGGRTAADKRVAKVAAGATQMAQTIGTIIAVGGDAECGAAVINGAPTWGQAIGDLSRYQPVLEKVFAPSGEITGQGFAWIAALAATAGIAVPILAHHNLISPAMASKFVGGTMAFTGMAGEQPAADAA